MHVRGIYYECSLSAAVPITLKLVLIPLTVDLATGNDLDDDIVIRREQELSLYAK